MFSCPLDDPFHTSPAVASQANGAQGSPGTGMDDSPPGVELGPSTGQLEALEINGADEVDLLVDVLSDVVFLWSARNQGLDDLDITVGDGHLELQGRQCPIVSQAKEVKAVTYHGLEVSPTEGGVEATITFDV